MLSRSSLGRSAKLAAVLPSRAATSSRSMATTATAATGSSLYQTSDASGIKVAAADVGHPTTTLAVVAKAGTRYQSVPGIVEALSAFAFKSTQNRSGLRINREAELLGGQLHAYHTRESLVLQAKCMREDLPFFAELLAEVVGKSLYLPHEYSEEIVPYLHYAQDAFAKSPTKIALNAAHTLAFHSGLGSDITAIPMTPLTKYVSTTAVKKFAASAYTRSNIAVVASGSTTKDLSNYVSEFFGDVSSGSASVSSPASKYHGGELRIPHPSAQSTVVLAFPGSSAYASGAAAYKPEIAVLSSLLGGKTPIKWSPGWSLLSKVVAENPAVSIDTSLPTYSDAGLLAITITGPAEKVASAAKAAVAALKSVAGGDLPKETLTKAIANAKFDAVEAAATAEEQLLSTGVSLLAAGKTFEAAEISKALSGVSASAVSKAAKAMLEGKATVATVGELHVLPWAEELGLKV